MEHASNVDAVQFLFRTLNCDGNTREEIKQRKLF